MRFMVLSLVVVLALLAVHQGATAKVFDPKSYTLSNGLELVVVPNRRAPVVHQMLWYRVGSVDEAPGQSGLAHYLEHLMFKGTKLMPPGGFSKAVAAAGGQDNAFTSYEYTAYFATVPSSFLPRLMDMEADRMANLTIDEVQAKPELDVVLAERRQRTDDNPDGRFNEKFSQKIYGKHPFGRPIIGWKQEVSQMNAALAKTFYDRWYAPNNALLVVAGDVEPEAVRALAEERFGKVPAKVLPVRPDNRKLFVPRRQPGRLVLRDPDVQQTSIERHFIAPSYHDAKGKDAYALEVLEQILGGGTVGRLYQTLVAEFKVATETSVGYDALSRDLGSFSIGLALPPAGNTAKAEAALDALLRQVTLEGVTQAEVDLAVKRLREQAVFTRDHLMTAGYAFGQQWASGRSVTDVEEWPERIGAVTRDDVNRVAKALFSQRGHMTGVLLPDKKHKNKSGAAVRAVTLPAGDIR